MGWKKWQVDNHMEAARLLIGVKDAAFDYARGNPGVTEYELQQFVLGQFEQNGIKIDKFPPIVSFREDTAVPEFYPSKKSKRLEPDSLIMLDIWARLGRKGSPFADITWMAYYGNKIPKDVLKVFNVVAKARDMGVSFLRSRLKSGRVPTGKEVDDAVKGVIAQAGYEKNMKHVVGHSLGTVSDHGTKPNWIYPKNHSPLFKNIGYSIEPGLYLKNRFGIRSEINVLIGKDMKLAVTTDVQKSIVRI